jgi:uncharacterized protein YbcV (DUF1398 family)
MSPEHACAPEQGIEKWTVDTSTVTMTFYDKSGREMLVEEIS